MSQGYAGKSDRGSFLLSLFLSAVTGFNAVLLYTHAVQRNAGWFVLILLIGFLLPGAIPFARLMESVRAGDWYRHWREPVAFLIGAVDSWAVLRQWPEGLGDLSWVSLYIIASGMAFLAISRGR
jgi:hypothetical protein